MYKDPVFLVYQRNDTNGQDCTNPANIRLVLCSNTGEEMRSLTEISSKGFIPSKLDIIIRFCGESLDNMQR